uniref:Uncharacterized protein n=1 Tax=Meloidogyne javanica TaxID=6303 RepID=A0A915N051_MELJA
MVLPTPTTNVEPPQQKVGGNCIEGLLSDYGLENAVQSLGTSTPYSEQSEDLGFGSLKSSDGWPAQQVPDFLPSSNNNSCQQQSNNLNKVPSNVCMCLEVGLLLE